MTTATKTRPEAKKVDRKKRISDRVDVKREKKKCGGGTEACKNCREKVKVRKARKKKKPTHKLGSWRGAFHGTLDF